MAGQSQSWLPTRAGKDDNPSLLSLLPALLKPQSLLGSPEDLCVCFTSSLENHSAIQTKAVLNSFKHRFIFFYFPNPTEREDTVKVLWPGFGIVAMSSTSCSWQPKPTSQEMPAEARMLLRCPSPRRTSPTATDPCVLRNNLTVHWEQVEAFLG